LVAGLRLVALVMYPVMPGTAVEILRRLGQPHDEADLLLENAVWERAAPAAVQAAPPLFPRIETPA
jgi:methionyl-tRNA synthetase